ncbi:uncharacterized protein [Maniola hyperantus]|uniref:uncharacterized protein n=1 Tax=Aphantopus hyperantus TaxID=2795564 RepID=UPI00374A3062
MTEIAVKHDRIRLPLRMSSFYELYKKFLKDHGCKWHDVAKLLNVVAEILFDVDGACTKIASKRVLCDENARAAAPRSAREGAPTGCRYF